MRSRTRRRAVAHASTSSTSTDVSANARTYAQQCPDADASANACVYVLRNVLVRTFLLRCLCMPSFSITLLGERREGRGEQLAVTSVPRTSSGPMRHLKLDVCALSASSSSYRSLRQSECYQLTFTLNSCLICYFWETGRLISSRVIRTMTYPCARCGDSVGNTAEENSRVFSVI